MPVQCDIQVNSIAIHKRQMQLNEMSQISNPFGIEIHMILNRLNTKIIEIDFGKALILLVHFHFYFE